jgi:hypothetical protein
MSKWYKGKPKKDYYGVLVWIENESGCGTYAGASVVDGQWLEWMTDEPFDGYTVVAWQELPDEYREE